MLSSHDAQHILHICIDADNMFHHLESGGHVDVGAQIWGVDLKLRADGSLEPQRVETVHAEN